ncbi:MAG: HAD-IA family hydrolase [Candidatus Babeliales bacterium]
MKKQPKNIIFDIRGVLFDYPEINWPEHLAKKAHINPFIPLEGFELLKALYHNPTNKHCSFYILSNFKPIPFLLLKKHFPELEKIFTGIVVTGSCPYKKPDPRIFEYLMNAYGLIAQESIFIDDTQANVTVANELGLQGVLWNPSTKVRDFLKKLNIGSEYSKKEV